MQIRRTSDRHATAMTSPVESTGSDGGQVRDRGRLRDRVRTCGPRGRRRRTAARHGRRAVSSTASSTSACPLPTMRVALPPDWALQDPDDYLRVLQIAPSRRSSGRRAWTRATSSASASTSRPARCCPPRPTARRSPSSPSLPREPACLGQALEAPRGPAPGGSDQRGRAHDRPALAGPLRRQDLVRVVLREGPPDPRGGARDLRGGRPAASRRPTGSSGG